MEEYKDKIYIIGSVAQADEIKSWADYYIGTGRYRVRYVKKEPEKSLKDLVDECFLNIIWADRVIVIPKPDGTVGQGVTYEMAFAKFLGKRVSQFYSESELNARIPKDCLCRYCKSEYEGCRKKCKSYKKWLKNYTKED